MICTAPIQQVNLNHSVPSESTHEVPGRCPGTKERQTGERDHRQSEPSFWLGSTSYLLLVGWRGPAPRHLHTKAQFPCSDRKSPTLSWQCAAPPAKGTLIFWSKQDSDLTLGLIGESAEEIITDGISQWCINYHTEPYKANWGMFLGKDLINKLNANA